MKTILSKIKAFWRALQPWNPSPEDRHLYRQRIAPVNSPVLFYWERIDTSNPKPEPTRKEFTGPR